MTEKGFAEYVWMDGELVKWDNATVHVMNHGLHYGQAVFEGIKGFPCNDDINVFRLGEHVDRLFKSARAYRLNIDYAKELIEEAVLQTIESNNHHTIVYARPIVYRGIEHPEAARLAPARTAIITVPWVLPHLVVDFEKKRKYIVSTWRKPAPDSMPFQSKCSANYANGTLAILEAEENGYDGAILLDHRGFVSETAGSSVIMVKKRQLVLPPLHASILEGITRETLLVLAKDVGIGFEERDVTRFELCCMDEVFLCGTACDVTPITEIDGITIGGGSPGPVTTKLATYYNDVVSGKVKEYRKWLTPVYKRKQSLP